ncbi:hypothetical protein HY501_02945 [Candidatus Woesearchaeota archaeon]|nr:hypothetical protein [Candidatus Woesearchaeota archaeon]
MFKKRNLFIALLILINLNLLITYSVIFYGTSQQTFEKFTGALTNQGQVSICIDSSLTFVDPGPLTSRAGLSFFYDINISNEAAYPVLNFSDNTSLFNINSSTGVINFTPDEANVGVNYINISIGNLACTDPDSTMILNLTINTSNTAPSIDLPEVFNLTEDITFTHNFSQYASDPEQNSLDFFDNTSLFVINQDTGIVSFTPTNDNVGKHSVRIAVVDTGSLTDFDDTIINISNVNDPPNLTAIGAQTEFFNFSFDLALEATDVDAGESLTFSSNTSWFLNSSSSIPTSGQVSAITLTLNITDFTRFNGTHYINVTVNDTSNELDSEVFSITFTNYNHPPNITSFNPGKNVSVDQGITVQFNITKEDLDGTIPTVQWYIDDTPVSGQLGDIFNLNSQSYNGVINISVIITDGQANDSESSIVTIITPTVPLSLFDPKGFGGGRGLRLFCDEIWICTDWSECPKSEIQIRDCNDIKKCGTTKHKPNLTQPCTYVEVPSCSDGVRNRGEILPDCGGPCPPCPTCDDDIQNHNEEDVDCGGPCKPCSETRTPAKVPGLEPKDLASGRFWWFWLIILLSILLALFLFRHKIKKWVKKIKEYLEVRNVNALIQESKKQLGLGNTHKAEELYQQANKRYKRLPKPLKAKIKI